MDKIMQALKDALRWADLDQRAGGISKDAAYERRQVLREAVREVESRAGVVQALLAACEEVAAEIEGTFSEVELVMGESFLGGIRDKLRAIVSKTEGK